MRKIIVNILYPIASLSIALLLWSVIALCYNEPLILPSVGNVASQLWTLLTTASTYSRIASTSLRTIACYVVSCVVASIMAVLSSFCNCVRRLLAPLVTVISAVPIVAITLIVVILLPSSYSPVFISMLVVLPIMYSVLLVAIDGVRPQLDMCAVYNVPKKNIVRYVHVPTMLPLLVQHCKITLVLALKVVVSAEVLAYTADSIGSGMYSARINIATAQLLAWTVICLVLCFAIQGIVSLAQYLVRRYSRCQ